MHYSGILILARPGELTAAAEEIAALSGVEVHFLDKGSGRILAVQETATAAAQEEGLRRIQGSTGVQLAALVHHRVDEGGGRLEPPGSA